MTINKPCIFVVSGGRTATRFISEVLALSVRNCFSVQEPDVWRLDSLIDFKKNRGMWIRKIRDFGFLNMTAGKLTTMGNPRGISLARQRGKLSLDEAAKKLYKVRSRFILRQDCDVYAECNLQLSGLIDVLPQAFPNSKTVFMIRDGRDWIRSWYNGYFAPYGPRDPFRYISSGRANAKMFPQDPFHDHWNRFSHFQKICWLWRFHADYALESLKGNPYAKVVRYEDLFQSQDFVSAIRNLLDYLTDFPNGFKAEFAYDGELEREKFHESRKNNFPDWKDWSSGWVRDFNEICGPLMNKQGYGNESQWQEMISGALCK